MRYTLEDFNRILNTKELNSLSEKTRDILNIISEQVGAPEYIKTPQFKKNLIFNKKKKLVNDLNDDAWESIRNFQTTEFIKKKELDININKIRKNLNILTLENLDMISENIIKEFEEVESTKTLNDLYILGEEFNKICTANMLYSNIYAKIFNNLYSKYSILNNILSTNINNLDDRLNNIIFISPDENYNKFCDNNKFNEFTRSITAFIVSLYKENIVKLDIIYNRIFLILNICDKYLLEEQKKNEFDELSEILYILVPSTFNDIKKENIDIATNIYNKILEISEMNIKKYPALTNKCIFKFMDILDIIEL